MKGNEEDGRIILRDKIGLTSGKIKRENGGIELKERKWKKKGRRMKSERSEEKYRRMKLSGEELENLKCKQSIRKKNQRRQWKGKQSRNDAEE